MRALNGLLVASLLAGCSSGVDPKLGSTERDLIPLAVGSEWTYSIADSGQFAARVFDSTRMARIVRDTVVAGRRWHFADATDLVVPLRSFPWIRNDAAGVVSGLPPFTVAWLQYQYPPTVGQVFNPGGPPARAADADTVVTVPAGTFHCVLYEWPDTSPIDNVTRISRWQFVSPGTGVVKDVVVRSRDGMGTIVATRVRVLLSYKP
jgi:hypothetical protein